MLDLLTVAVLAFFGSRLLVSFRRSLGDQARDHALALVRGLRLRHFAPVPVVIAVVVAAAIYLVQLPVLSFGWWTAIGGQGNPAFGVTDRTVGTPLEILVPLVFIVLLTPALPLLVEREERFFRYGAEGWPNTKRAAKAIGFGLVHAVVGIPLGVALALAIPGAWLTATYLRGARAGGRLEGLRESTRAHLAYDLVIVAVVMAALLLELALIVV